MEEWGEVDKQDGEKGRMGGGQEDGRRRLHQRQWQNMEQDTETDKY